MQFKNNAYASQARVSYYRTIFDKTGLEITVQNFLDEIAHQKYSEQINNIRLEIVEEKQKKLKEQLPAVTIAGTFETKTNLGLREPSNLMAMDFDHLDGRLEEAKMKLKNDPYTYAVWTSARGNGLCVIVKIDYEQWEAAFKSLEFYYLDTYGIVADTSCKNVSRLRFISSDPDLFHNEQSQLFKTYLKPAERKKKEKAIGAYIHTSSDIEHIVKQLEERKLDLTATYEDWYRIGFSIVAKMKEGGRNYFHRVSQFHPQYNIQECDRVFDYLSRYGAREITIATFYHYAKQAGVEIMTPNTCNIVSIATMHRKQKATFEETVNSIVTMLKTEPVETSSIVSQVYESKGTIETEQTIYQQAALHIKQKMLRFNSISRRIEDNDGSNLEERELNDLFIELLNIFNGKLKRSDFDTIIKSSEVPTYNPCRSFFARYKSRMPTGVIKALADTIETDTGFCNNEFDPTYKEYFIRKWLIGLVASVHGDICSLMLVLTGEQGTGKTEWFRRLLPEELRPYYAESKFDAGKDDEILMCQKLILMNDELEGLTIQDAKKLKSLTSKQYFDLREPYGRVNVTLQRLALLCGTSNPREVISDPTGNRRIVPINILQINHVSYNKIDKIDLLMEAYYAWKAGESHYLSSDDRTRLRENTDGFQQNSIERQLLEQYFTKSTGKDGEKAEFLAAIEIQIYLEQRANNRRLSDRKISLELKAMGFETEQRREYPKRRKRGFNVVKLIDS